MKKPRQGRGGYEVDAMFKDEKINYTNYLRDNPQETDPEKLAPMKAAVIRELKRKGVHGHISCMYYRDGRVNVGVDGKPYGVFDCNTGKFFEGYVGD